MTTTGWSVELEIDPRDLNIEAMSILWGMPVVDISIMIDTHIERGTE